MAQGDGLQNRYSAVRIRPAPPKSLLNRFRSESRLSNVSRRSDELATRKISALGVVEPPPIRVTTPKFDGSLATLFSCVRDHKVDLLDVPLFPICEAYFYYLMHSERQDLDESAAALAALAYLLERKAWALLPSAAPEPEIEDDLTLPPPSAHEFRLAIEALAVLHDDRSNVFFRSAGIGPNPYELPYEVGDISAEDLARAFEQMLKRATPEPFESPSRPRQSLQEQMRFVLLLMSFEWRTLDQLLPNPYTRTDAVYWFLAVLELMRLGQVQARILDEEIVFARA